MKPNLPQAKSFACGIVIIKPVPKLEQVRKQSLRWDRLSKKRSKDELFY
jgi:hypothetical protein